MDEDADKIINIANPCQYIYSEVPGFTFSISKLKLKSSVMYDLVEINSFFNLLEMTETAKTHILGISQWSEDFNYFINIMQNINNSVDSFPTLNDINIQEQNKMYHFIFIEDETTCNSSVEAHIQNIIKTVFLIFNLLEQNGNCLIKINNVFYKPFIEAIYLFSNLFEKVSIIKPTSSNLCSFEKYIFCKKFTCDQQTRESIIKSHNWESIIRNDNNSLLSLDSIINSDIPCYFFNKIQDLNSVLLQQQLEAIELITNILKTKNKEEKLEILKKNNIQKSITWCEKFKIPHYKIAEKNNIFLPNFTHTQTQTKDVSDVN